MHPMCNNCLYAFSIEQLGGVEFYQHLSKNAEQRHGNFNSAKWVVAVLTEQGVLASHSQVYLSI